jgi:Rrf2 family iron-sulfur cluster assembly transcriptional regulator
LKDLTKEMKIPPHFGSKVLQQLTRTKILISSRGSDGGFIFRKSPNKVTVLDIVESFGAAESIEKNCFLGAGKCNSLKPCPAHEKWVQAREKLMEVMHSSIGSMTEKLLLGNTFLMKDS